MGGEGARHGNTVLLSQMQQFASRNINVRQLGCLIDLFKNELINLLKNVWTIKVSKSFNSQGVVVKGREVKLH